MNYAIYAISTGKIESLQYEDRRPMKSALNKSPSKKNVAFSDRILEDEQEYKDHGGPDKAVCLYSKSNYAMWQDVIQPLPDSALFGENITVYAIDETELFFR